MSKWKQYLIAALTALLAALGGTAAVHRFGMANASPGLGCTTVATGKIVCSRSSALLSGAADASVLIAPFGAAVLPIPTGATANIFAATTITASSCDGGLPCDCLIKRFLPCRNTGTQCLRTDSTPSNQVTADIDNGSVCGMTCSAPITVTAGGVPQVNAICNVPFFASGDQDFSYSIWDAAPPPPSIPQIVAMGPNAGPAGGGIPLSGTCTNCATGNTLTIGGTQTASITVTGAGPTFAWSATLPAWTSTSGSASLQTLTISNSAGSSSFSEGFYYYPAICRFLELYDDPRIAASVVGGCVTSVPDDSGNNLAVTIGSTNSTCLGFLGDGSGIGTGGALNFGTGGPYLTVASFGSYAQPVTFMAAIQAQTVSATPTIVASNNAAADVSLALNSSGELQAYAGSTAAATGMSSIFGSPEIVASEINGSSTIVQLGSTSETLSPTSPGGNALTGLTIGNSAAHSTAAQFVGRIGDICVAPIAAITSGYYNAPGAALAILENRYGLIPPPPTITSFGPGIGPASGGITLTGTGTNLINGATLNLGSVSTTISATSCTNGLCTAFTATSPAWTSGAGTSTPQAITITTTGGTSAPYLGGNNGQGFQFVPSSVSCPLKMLPLADDPRVQTGGTLNSTFPDDSGNGLTVTSNSAGWRAAGAGIGNIPTFVVGGATLTIPIGTISQPYTMAITFAPRSGSNQCNGTSGSNNVLLNTGTGSQASLAISNSACSSGVLDLVAGTLGCGNNSSLCSTSATFVNTAAGTFNAGSSLLELNGSAVTLSPQNIGTDGLSGIVIGAFNTSNTNEYFGMLLDPVVWGCDAISNGFYATYYAIEASRD